MAGSDAHAAATGMSCVACCLCAPGLATHRVPHHDQVELQMEPGVRHWLARTQVEDALEDVRAVVAQDSVWQQHSGSILSIQQLLVTTLCWAARWPNSFEQALSIQQVLGPFCGSCLCHPEMQHLVDEQVGAQEAGLLHLHVGKRSAVDDIDGAL